MREWQIIKCSHLSFSEKILIGFNWVSKPGLLQPSCGNGNHEFKLRTIIILKMTLSQSVQPVSKTECWEEMVELGNPNR